MTRIAFVTNFCPHYRVQTFEMLAQAYDIDFYFFSEGKEWYTQRQLGTFSGNFKAQELPLRSSGTRQIVPPLFRRLWSGDYDLFLKCINGKIEVPGTYAIAKARRKPFVLWTGIWHRIDTPLQKASFPLVRTIYRNSTSIVTYGTHINRYLISEGVNPDKIFATRHAVNNDDYNGSIDVQQIKDKRHELEILDGQKVVLYVGRLIHDKGVDYLFQAFSQLPDDDAILVIVGTGSETETFRELARTLHVADKVRFVGFVSQKQTPLFYAMAWTNVLPSITTALFKEPWGLVVNEAFNQGVPVIASTAVGAAAGGLVQEGKTGFIVPERDAHALAQALTKMLRDEELHAAMSVEARRVIAHWSNREMVEGFKNAIDYALARKV